MFKAQFPVQYCTLAKLPNYEAQLKRKDWEHLHDFYNQMILYQFMSICLVHSHKKFSWWALVSACMCYGGCRVTLTLAPLDSVFFGHSITQTFVMRKMKTFQETTLEYYQRIIDSLALPVIHTTKAHSTQLNSTQLNSTLWYFHQIHVDNDFGLPRIGHNLKDPFCFFLNNSLQVLPQCMLIA
jgi:hypothetical protein